MTFDIHAKSQQLLEQVAISMYDRAPEDDHTTFTIREIHVVETFLRQFGKELLEQLGQY